MAIPLYMSKTCLAVLSLLIPLATQAAPAVRTIETPNATLRLDADSGDLVGLDWKKPALRIIEEPRLGENFRLLLPKPGYEAAYFNSRDQKVSRIEETRGWRGLPL